MSARTLYEAEGSAPTARRLRVIFDVTPELVATTGVARYSRELGRALDELGECELRRIGIGRRTQPLPSGTKHLPIPLVAVRLAWRTVGMPRAEAIAEGDVVHSLDLQLPPTRRPLVVTMHDVVAVEHAGLHPGRSVAIQHSRLAALRRANVVLAVSQSTADELVERGVDPGRITVTHNGLTPLPPPIDPPVPPGPFVLVVGTLEPRKGHDVLLRAFASPRFDDYQLVFAGPPADRASELASLADELGLGTRLTILGVVPDEVLAGLYRDASVLCMPSLAEGFGLPALEAMAFGVPVVASDIGAVREVTGEGAELVAPGSQGALASGLDRVLNDRALQTRLRRSGAVQASRFTWEEAARLTLAAYQRAVREGPISGL